MKHFDKLQLYEKLMFVGKYGRFICSCRYGEYNVSLYQLYNSLIEQYYNTNTGVFESVRIASTNDFLKYVDGVSIEELLDPGKLK
jgi:hypothetical protein